MRKYEIMYILDQDVKDTAKLIAKLNDVLTNGGGKIIETAEWGLRDFAYEINHKKKGYYVVSIVEANSEAIAEFKRISKNDRKNIVRTLVLNTELIQNYITSTKLSKTDMAKYDEERRENKKPKFKRNFNRDFKNSNSRFNRENKEQQKEEVSISQTNTTNK